MINRFQTLDGWRGVSILLVLVGHLFPLGPKSWQLNSAIAGCGMVIFFYFVRFFNYESSFKKHECKEFFNPAVYADYSTRMVGNDYYAHVKRL